MTDFLLIVIVLVQLVQIVIMFLVLRAIDNNDLSIEDAKVKDATDKVQEAQRNLPPQT